MNAINPLDIIQRDSDETPFPIFRVMQECGLDYILRPLPENISGYMACLENSRYLAIVNNVHAISRQRFTAAHQLGHFIHHRELLGQGTVDSLEYRSVPGFSHHNTHLSPLHENQASAFAANVLMSRQAIEKLRKSGLRTTKALADELGVTYRMMALRLGEPHLSRTSTA